MGSQRQLAIELKQDISTSSDPGPVRQRLQGHSAKDIEELCSMLIDGTSVFHTIAAHDRAEILDFILQKGVDINSVDKTALHVAVSHKAVKTTKLLLDNGANIKVMGPDGKTPLHIAAEMGNTEIVKELLAHNVEVLLNRPEMSGCTPLSLACLSGREDTVKLLVDHGAWMNHEGCFSPVHAAAMTGNMNILRMLAHKGATWCEVDHHHVTPLHYAVYKGHKKVVGFLLEAGADPTVKDGKGKTPLELAKAPDIQAMLEAKCKS